MIIKITIMMIMGMMIDDDDGDYNDDGFDNGANQQDKKA